MTSFVYYNKQKNITKNNIKKLTIIITFLQYSQHIQNLM